MPTLLAVESSPRGEYSLSRSLTSVFVEAWKSAHPGGEVVTRDLMKTDLPFVDLPWIGGAYTPREKHSPEMARAIKVSDDLVAELQPVDHLVIGTSMYNFSTPANLKAYIDHIVRIGVTVSAKYEGLLKGKKATVILASGGVYTPDSPMASYNKETDYLKAILAFIGITDVTFVLAGGTSAINTGKATLQDLVDQYKPEVQKAAQA